MFVSAFLVQHFHPNYDGQVQTVIDVSKEYLSHLRRAKQRPILKDNIILTPVLNVIKHF